MPRFIANTGDALQEQTAFAAVTGMRNFITQNVWSRVSPNRSSNVDIHYDSTETSSAFFDDVWTAIHVDGSLSGETDVYWHEYGHYVVWTYDDVSDECIEGDDHGNPMDETLADVFGLLAALDDPIINPTYGAISNFAFQAPGPHVDPSLNGLQFVDDCDVEFHIMGRAFEQAVWELLWNSDCSYSDFCSDTMAFGNTIWPTANQEEVIAFVGESLAFALKVLPGDVTFAQLAYQMGVKVRQEHGTTVAARFSSVLLHHNFP